jgi:hypothetical protein
MPTVPDQGRAISLYITGLGLTRDPFIMAGIENIWVNETDASPRLSVQDRQA